MGIQASATADELERPQGRPAPERRAPGAEPAKHLLMSAAVMAIGGSWLVSGRPAQAPVPAEPSVEAPAPALAPLSGPEAAPAEPLVPLAMSDRATLPAEDGLVSLLLSHFDINGDGILDYLSDVSSKDGLLVFDAEGDGLSGGHARELFGNETDLDMNGLPDGYPDGFAALRAFVQKARKEGVLAAEPPADGWLEEADLAALERRYGLRMRVGGIRARAVSLKEAGVSRIRLSIATPRRIKDFDGQKNDLMRQEGALFSRADGSLGVYEDVWFRAQTKRVRQTALAKAR